MNLRKRMLCVSISLGHFLAPPAASAAAAAAAAVLCDTTRSVGAHPARARLQRRQRPTRRGRDRRHADHHARRHARRAGGAGQPHRHRRLGKSTRTLFTS